MESSASTLAPDEQEQPDFCPRCGAAYAPSQEYCLECGARLPVNSGFVGVLASGWQRRLAWYPGDWVWPALGLLLLAVVATALAVALGSRSTGTHTLVATGNSVPFGPGAVRATAPAVTTTAGPLPTAPEPTVPETTATPAKPPGNGLAVWPAGTSGYTVVLQSIPTSAGRALALARAKAARSAGLRQVGVLDSSRYSSFHPGYFVVFAGIYSSYEQASQAVSTARGHGYGDAYPKQVTR